MRQTVDGVVPIERKKALGAPDLRKEWCQCADELGEMVHQEFLTNPRYKDVELFPGKKKPPR